MSTTGSGLNTSRFARLLALIGFVTAVFLLTAAQVLTDALFSIAVVAIGCIALVTAILGFVIALASGTDDPTLETDSGG